jgi:hypothetical protein
LPSLDHPRYTDGFILEIIYSRPNPAAIFFNIVSVPVPASFTNHCLGLIALKLFFKPSSVLVIGSSVFFFCLCTFLVFFIIIFMIYTQNV